jgi:signal transduction histidine kinase
LVADQIVLPYLWRRYLSLLRALVGGACLWALLGSPGVPASTLVALLAVVTVYSAISVFWRWPERVDRLDILNLVLDLVVFLLSVILAPPPGFWLPAMSALYLYLAMSTLHDWREVLLTTVLTMSFVSSVAGPGGRDLIPILLLLGMFGMVTSLQKQSLLERLSNASRQALHHRIEAQRAREAERERIAADFHDGPLQSFISVQMRLEILRRMFQKNPEMGMEELAGLQKVVTGQVAEVRTFIRGMRPVEVEGTGLAAALRQTVGFFQKDCGMTATFKAGANAMHDDLEASLDIVQIVREALNNVRKHSSASRVAVSLDRVDGNLALEVEDDGTGFPFAGEFSLEEMELLRMGPESIKRRVRGLNGDLRVVSRPGRGSTLRMRVPLT